jgi:long-chain acyl-CoA synthetase
MHPHIETLLFVAYLDSLFAEGGEGGAREVAPLRAVPETLNRLHADAMRQHARRTALLIREEAEWRPMPDWRLDRQIIRLGLYLREQLGVAPGERVALLSELRPEWLIADLAALGLGAVSVAIDPRLRGEALADALEDTGPSVTFVSGAAHNLLVSLDGRAPRHGQLIALDSAVTSDGVMSLHTLLEMGGTLDTPERAQSYRTAARDLAPDWPAIRHYRQAAGGGLDRVELSQGEVIARLRAGRLREQARPGDLAYVSDPTISLAGRLALYAFLGDGYTTTALAPAGRELSDLAALHPTKIVAPAALLAEAVRAGEAREEERSGSDGGWLRHAARSAPLARARRDRRAVRDTLGGRARWVGSTEPLDSALAGRLRSVAVVGPVPS